jgi:hypothetical protein
MPELFENKLTTKKGDVGESLVDKMLREKGFVIYKPEGGQAHAFDRLAIKDKEILMIAEVKAKAKRKYFPDTGIDFRHYKEYKNIMKKHNLEVILFFVDEEMGKIYGGKLSEIEVINNFKVNNKDVTYPKIEKNIIYFHIEKMNVYAELEKADVISLEALTTKKQAYR